MCTTLVEKLLGYGEQIPSKTAVAFRKEQLTYGDLSLKIRQTAAALKELGIGRGDRVLFTAVSKPSTFVLYMGVQYLGGIAVFTDKAGTWENAVSIYEDAEASLFLTTMKQQAVPDGMKVLSQKDFFARAEEMTAFPEFEEPEGEAVAEILFTTGTTGKPKGVMLSFRAVMNILKNTMRGVGIRPEDIVLMPLPLHHSFALRVSRAALYAGGTVVLQNGFAFAKETENNLDQFGCTGIAAVPVSMELLRTQMQEHFYEIMSRFRFIEVGAGALTEEQRKRLSAHLPGVQITNTWGSSETGGVIFTYVHDVASDERRVTTLGKPIDGASIRVIGPDGEMYKCWDDVGLEEKVVGHIDRFNDWNMALIAEGMTGCSYLDDPECKECYYFPICNGGCHRIRQKNLHAEVKHSSCTYFKGNLENLLELYYEQKRLMARKS